MREGQLDPSERAGESRTPGWKVTGRIFGAASPTRSSSCFTCCGCRWVMAMPLCQSKETSPCRFARADAKLLGTKFRVASQRLSVTDGWMNRMCYLHAEEYYSALKRNGILTHAATRLNLENRWTEKSQMQKATQRVVSFRGNVQERHVQRQKDERSCQHVGGWEEGK